MDFGAEGLGLILIFLIYMTLNVLFIFLTFRFFACKLEKNISKSPGED